MYAMDMRQYDPAIARWIVQDPIVHHNMSPYNAFDNNPVYWADPSGADVEETEDSWNFTGEDAKSLFLLLTNGGDDDKKKNRESERRRERQRDRNRSRIGSGSVLFDARGQELLSHWLNGSGTDLNLSGENWGDYMKDNDLLASQIQGKLRDFLISMREKVKTGGKHNVNITFHGEIENGYFTGYEMLHGSHSGLGDTQIKGTVQYNSKTKQFDFNVNLIWNDKIDPNPQYGDDIRLSNFLNIFYTPKDYNVKIKWNDKISIK